MASSSSSPSISVFVECVSSCKLPKGDGVGGGGGRYDCSVISCAWKAPRALTGSLASTAHPHQSSCPQYGRFRRRNHSIDDYAPFKYLKFQIGTSYEWRGGRRMQIFTTANGVPYIARATTQGQSPGQHFNTRLRARFSRLIGSQSIYQLLASSIPKP